MKGYPITKQELLKQVALETARMSYPGDRLRTLSVELADYAVFFTTLYSIGI